MRDPEPSSVGLMDSIDPPRAAPRALSTTTSGTQNAAENAEESDEVIDASRRRLVFAALGGGGWAALSPVPSADITLFFGSTLRPRIGRKRTWRGAIGYAPTVSVGGADYATAYATFGGGYGLVYHRHHVEVMGYGGRRDRLYYAIGGGPLLWATTLTALEVEARLGAIFHARRRPRLKGLVGGRARLVSVLDGFPMPHFGLFAGIAHW